MHDRQGSNPAWVNPKSFNAWMRHVGVWFILLLVVACGRTTTPEVQHASEHLPETVDYNFHVKPILSDRCFNCHGPDVESRKADLRLDIEEEAVRSLKDGGRAIAPGKPGKSMLVHRILSDEAEYMMPPPDAKLTLTAREKALLIRWIEQGAEYKSHWSFEPVQQPAVPALDDPWIRNPIDAFVLERMHENDLEPAAEASTETLLRRLHFDLTGLPPEVAEIDRFIEAGGEDAYEQKVDELLSRPSYGERMTADWLDVARFADSDGYLDDKHRDFSPWRDWVIRAFNRNMPYDRFGTWQIAGDLLPEASQESILATAFNRLHKKNSEAGIVFEEYRVEYVADRTHTVAKAFMGLSIECARCHDHKYDPISQRDYYRFFGFFNSTHELGTPVYGPDQTPGPALLLTTARQDSIREFLSREIAGQLALRKSQEQAATPAFRRWLEHVGDDVPGLDRGRRRGMVAHHNFDQMTVRQGKVMTPNLADPSKPARLIEPVLKPGIQGDAFAISDYNHVDLAKDIGWFERTEPFTVDLWIHPDRVYPEAGIFSHCEDFRLGYKGYSLHVVDNRLRFIIAHSWPHNAIQLTTVEALPAGQWSHLTITYDGSSAASGVAIYVDGQRAEAAIEADNLYKGILYEYDIHTYGFRGFTLGYRDKIIPMKGSLLDELRIFDRRLTALEVAAWHDGTSVEMLLASADREAYLFDYFLQHIYDGETSAEGRLKLLRDTLNVLMNEIPELMVMGDLPEPRPTYLLHRGSYDQPGERVEVQPPEAVMAYDEALPRNRLGLAQWLFDPRHPLTARVFVNRMWQMHFGQGLVRTAEDFGAQGALPSHPELLDWLADHFVASGWDIKALHRLIVTSATYRQSSKIDPISQEVDPENIWLSRGPRFRLPAEMLRDNALAISQLLVDKLGGESVYPYQPAGLWDEISNKKWRYPYLQGPGEGLCRRSIYSIFKRTAPPPSMLIFDMPDRSNCTVRRTTTSTPLQALVLLNDPQYVEASRALAERMLATKETDQRSIETIFRLSTGRLPDTEELRLLRDFYRAEVERFQREPDKALAYLSNGELARDPQLDPAAVAALAVTCNSIWNTDEAQIRK